MFWVSFHEKNRTFKSQINKNQQFVSCALIVRWRVRGVRQILPHFRAAPARYILVSLRYSTSSIVYYLPEFLLRQRHREGQQERFQRLVSCRRLCCLSLVHFSRHPLYCMKCIQFISNNFIFSLFLSIVISAISLMYIQEEITCLEI